MNELPPPFGLTVPVEVERVIDGDTLVVTLPGSAFIWRVRLMDCWAPELPSVRGKVALQFLETYLAKVKDLRLHIPITSRPHEILSATTLGRVLGYVWCDGKLLNREIVAAGHATRSKNEL
jgi:endonuclease YncB( thermonuclease family)